MKRQREITQRRYNDPPSNQWEAPYQGRIDAMVLLADDDRNRLERSVAAVLESIPGVFEKLTVESGRKIKQQFLEPRGELVIEHFGFQDGVSQPIMIQQDLDRELRQRGSTYWNPIAPLSLALVEEPGSARRYGSFMVFRKLEQDVKAFWEALTKLSNQTNIALETAGAMAVGRFPNGAPARPDLDDRSQGRPERLPVRPGSSRGTVPLPRPHPEDEPTGRSAVRDGRETETADGDDRVRAGSAHRPPRHHLRGRPDLRPGSTLDKPSQGVGLLFMCFQANLDQFVIQQEGSDSNIFVRDGTGFDAVIGQFHGPPDDPAAPIDQTWPSTATSDTNKFKMVNFVRMRGGEYFFTPSMSFLKELGQS